jgi:hypothetical protein
MFVHAVSRGYELCTLSLIDETAAGRFTWRQEKCSGALQAVLAAAMAADSGVGVNAPITAGPRRVGPALHSWDLVIGLRHCSHHQVM